MPLPTWAAPAIEAAGAVATSATSGLFGVNQAKKNRAFQERMYYQQLEDNRENWERMNRYNLPSAQLARLRNSGLNPLLMYGEGGVSNVAANTANGASAPSGSQGQASFSNPFAGFSANMKQMQLLDAEIDKLRAEKNKTVSETEWQNIENKYSQDTYQVRQWILHGQNDLINEHIRETSQNILNSAILTYEQAATMAQSRIYQIKEFNLSEKQVTTALEQRWFEVKTGRIAANAQLQQAAAAWLNAKSNYNLTNWQINGIAQDIYYKSQYQPYVLKNYSLQNELNKFNVGSAAQDFLIKNLRYKTFQNFGNETLPNWAVPFFIWSSGKDSSKTYEQQLQE